MSKRSARRGGRERERDREGMNYQSDRLEYSVVIENLRKKYSTRPHQLMVTRWNGKWSTLEAWASSSCWAGGTISNFSFVPLPWSVANLRSFPREDFISSSGETLAPAVEELPTHQASERTLSPESDSESRRPGGQQPGEARAIGGLDGESAISALEEERGLRIW